MPPRLRTAITLPGPSGNVAETLALARRAESAGYDDLWLADAGGMDALTLAALIAQNTTRARIGIAVVPAGSRHYEGGQGETIVALLATGPFTTTFVDSKQP